MITPDYYDAFSCIGGSCKKNCCKGGWQIEIDDDALKRFSEIEGEFGEKVRGAIDDENCFRHVNGQCPLLSDDGWCEMALRGHKLCTICDEYPRFTEFWENYSERGISLSCEAAAQIILSNKKKVSLTGTSDGECTHPLFLMLIDAREKIFSILQNRELDIFTRIRLVLDYGQKLQDKINNDDYSKFTYEPRDTKTAHTDLNDIIIVLREDLEILTDEWREKLDILKRHEENAPRHTLDDMTGEQLAVYFVFRYFLKGAFDCDPLSKLKFMALSVMIIAALSNVFGNIEECASLYSTEIEHDEDNVDYIYDEFLFNSAFSLESLISKIG